MMDVDTEVSSVWADELIAQYLPANHEFGNAVDAVHGSHNNKWVPALPAMKLLDMTSDKPARMVEHEIPEGASMSIYAHYSTLKLERTIAAIFFPDHGTQIKILSGGIIVVRRF